MRYTISLILFCGSLSFAQKKNDAAILNPINTLFAAMEKGDSALLSTAFFSDVTLITVLEKDGKINLRKEGLQDFMNAVGMPHAEKWHEPIWSIKVQQDGNFAQVWADYAFYRGAQFSHCGVDTFQLIKTASGWKIFYLADTRHTTGCNVPDKIARAFTQSK